MTKNQQIPNKSPAIPLNPAQKAAAEAKNAPLLIVAGAGTGKTKTLTSRILYLIEQGVAPDRICAITFTNKAAKEMANRVNRSGPFLGTFHALGARILRKESMRVGRDPNFAIFDDHDSFDLVKKAVKGILPKPINRTEDGEGRAIEKINKKETPSFFAQKIAEMKNLDRMSGDAKSSPEKNAAALKVFAAYEAALQRNNAFDFDDLIQKPVTIFKEHPEVSKKYQDKFDVILVDEYQDINPKQYELVTLLAGAHRNLSVVGDDEQTIYSWRYADIKTFLNFDKDWKGAAIHFLEENYRSTGTIIRAAAAVAKNNRFRTPKNLWTKNPDGDPIKLFEAWGENEEAEWIADEIQKLRKKDINAEIGILYRTNAQSRAIEQALIRHNFPYRIFGGLKFYERREVKDAVAALRYISNDKDELARERLEKNLTKKKFAAFKARIATAAAKGTTLAPLEALKLFLETFNYLEYLEENFINADERQENITELVAFASGFPNLEELLERLSLLQAADDIGKSEEEGAEVNLMTIHLAKGLEFDSVFIAGVAEGLLPHGRSLENEDSLEEERRLMYVAMTRAKKRLFISFSGIPSRFIGEIPEDCVTFAEGSSSDFFSAGKNHEANDASQDFGYKDEDGEQYVFLD